MIDLLEWLQKKAWREIRTKVLRTISLRLPAEMTELVIEWVLIAEDVPNVPTVRDKDNHRPEILNGEAYTFYDVKPEYKCRNVRALDREMIAAHRPMLPPASTGEAQ